MIGSAFAILGTYFSGLAFIALIATLLVQKEQVESTLRTMEANSSFQTLASFQVRVAELIGKSDKNILDDFSNVQVEIKAHMMASRSIQANDNLLHSLSDIFVASQFPESDAFRRHFLFSALHSFLANAPRDQRQTLENLLLAQVHDNGMRLLIFQAIATRDEPLLRIYANLGFNAAVLNEFDKDLRP
jgi:hypothetical protein